MQRAKDVWKLDESTFPTKNKRHQKTTDPRSSENSEQNKCQKKKRKNEKSKFTLYYSRGNSEKAMAPHSSTLAWKIPWTEEPVRLQSMGSLGVGHDWATSLSLFTFMHWRRKWQPTPVFLPGDSQGRGAWWAAAYGVTQSWTRLKRLSSSSSRAGPESLSMCVGGMFMWACV